MILPYRSDPINPPRGSDVVQTEIENCIFNLGDARVIEVAA